MTVAAHRRWNQHFPKFCKRWCGSTNRLGTGRQDGQPARILASWWIWKLDRARTRILSVTCRQRRQILLVQKRRWEICLPQMDTSRCWRSVCNMERTACFDAARLSIHKGFWGGGRRLACRRISAGRITQQTLWGSSLLGGLPQFHMLATLAFPSHREPQNSKIYCHFIPIPHSSAILPWKGGNYDGNITNCWGRP